MEGETRNGLRLGPSSADRRVVHHRLTALRGHGDQSNTADLPLRTQFARKAGSFMSSLGYMVVQLLKAKQSRVN